MTTPPVSASKALAFVARADHRHEYLARRRIAMSIRTLGRTGPEVSAAAYRALIVCVLVVATFLAATVVPSPAAGGGAPRGGGGAPGGGAPPPGGGGPPPGGGGRPPGGGGPPPGGGWQGGGGWHGGGGWSGWRGWNGRWWGPSVYVGAPFWYPYGYAYPYAYPYAFPYAAYPPPVVVEESAPPLYTQDAPQAQYWYYCQNPPGYYPYVNQCPAGWLQVVPQPTPPPPGEAPR